MNLQPIIPTLVFKAFDLPVDSLVKPLGSGHIHQTFLIEGARRFVLQRVNKNIFTKPEVIASNNRLAANYLAAKFPDYLFPTTIPTQSGGELVYDADGFPWRLYPLIENTQTVDFVTSEAEAYEAAKGFAKLSHKLNGIDCSLFKPTIL